MARTKSLNVLPPELTVKRKANKHARVFISYSSLDWYDLTESTRHVLNSVITDSAKKQVEERSKAQPNQQKLQALRMLSQNIAELSRDPKNFESKQRMEEILEEYADIEIV